MVMNESRELAAFISRLSVTDLQPEVVTTAKLCVLDTIGVALVAGRREWSQIVADVVALDARSEGSAVWGSSGLRVTPAMAAMVNGTAAHGIEMDDRIPTVLIHPGSNVVPAAIAVCEEIGASGRELI